MDAPNRREERSIAAWNKLPPADAAIARQIIKEELEKAGLFWEHLVAYTNLLLVTKTRWRIIWRMSRETRCKPYKIAALLRLDHTTVNKALAKMNETDGKFFEMRRPIKIEAVRAQRLNLKRLTKSLGLGDVAL